MYCPSDCRDPILSNLQVYPGLFQRLVYTNGLSWLMLQTFLKISQRSSIWPLLTLYHLLSCPGPALAATSLGSHLGISWGPPSPVQVAAICRSLCSLCQVAPDKTQAVPDLGLHLLGGLRASTLSGQLQITSKYRHQTTSTSETLK